MRSASIPPPSTPPRSRWLNGLLALFVVAQLTVAINTLWGMSQPSGGFVVQNAMPTGLAAIPVTGEAQDATSAHAYAYSPRAINGQALEGEFAQPLEALELVDVRPGARNRFALEDRTGEVIEVEIPVGVPTWRGLLRVWPIAPLYEFVGLLYFALGVLVWWKRPGDRATGPMLLFALVGAHQMTVRLGFGPIGQASVCLGAMVFPFYGPTLLNLGLHFTGCVDHVWPRRVLRASVVGSALLAAAVLLASLGIPGRDVLLTVVTPVTGVLLLVTVLTTVAVSITASRPPFPLGLRRRARVLALACAVAFIFPSSSLVIPGLPVYAYWVVFVCLGSFPVFIAYAIVRHGMFDFRVVLGRGLVYAALSLGVLLAYLGLVMVGGKLLARAPHSPGATAVTVMVLVVLLSLVQLKVQRALNRRLFRRRYAYADAMERASEAVTRARSHEAVAETLREALLDAMELSRASFAKLDPRRGTLHCVTLGSKPDKRTGEVPPELPGEFKPRAFEPVARALRTRELVTGSDTAATSAQHATPLDDLPPESVGYGEGTFWPHYGIETIVPLTVGADAERRTVVGLLLLGPRRDERPLDRADFGLLNTLANQLAIAIENASAFEEIQRLKDNLEEQVKERTQDLSTALEDLKQAQAQLIETEKQAVLGRLVAGIVHEVNTPLGVLHSSADTTGRMLNKYREFVEAHAEQDEDGARRLLAATALGPELAALMKKSSDRLTNLVASLKQFVALDAAEFQTFDVREGIDSAVTLLSPAFGEGVEISREYADEQLMVDCYPAKLNQVFVNLLENAAAAVDGNGQVRINVGRANGRVEIEFTDNGRGIPADRLSELFEIGFTEKSGRMGLRMGLPSSKRSVEDLGGEISIASEPGAGTQVRLSLPATAA